MGANWNLRPADPGADAAACAEIYRPYVTESWVSFEIDPPDRSEMERRIGDYSASHAWLVSECDGVVQGYAYGSPHRSRAAYASSCDVAIYLAEDVRRKGLGRALYGALLPALNDLPADAGRIMRRG